MQRLVLLVGLIMLIVGALVFRVCIIHQSTQIDGFTTRKLNIQSSDFEIYLSNDTGKMRATYTGDKEYGAVLVEKSNEAFKNTYIIKRNSSEILSCTYGNGNYIINLCEKGSKAGDLSNIEKYNISLNIDDQLATFKGSSYYTEEITDIANITNGIQSDNAVDFANKAYTYMIKNITYDDGLAALVKKGEVDIHKPNIKDIIENKKGICIDQASLLGSMLKKKGIPVKIVMGFTNNNQYHAWVEAYVGGTWRVYDSTLKKTYLEKETEAYEIVKYY